jgi:hypothetical protein
MGWTKIDPYKRFASVSSDLLETSKEGREQKTFEIRALAEDESITEPLSRYSAIPDTRAFSFDDVGIRRACRRACSCSGCA